MLGPHNACRLLARRSQPHGLWHLDETFVRIDGKQIYLWSAVVAEGEVLNVLVQPRRDTAAAGKLVKMLLNRRDECVTDRYAAYGAAFRDLGLTASVRILAKRMNTGPKVRMCRCDDESGSRKASRRRVRHSGSWPCRPPPTTPSPSPSPQVRPNAPVPSSRGILGMARGGWCRRLILSPSTFLAALFQRRDKHVDMTATSYLSCGKIPAVQGARRFTPASGCSGKAAPMPKALRHTVENKAEAFIGLRGESVPRKIPPVVEVREIRCKTSSRDIDQEGEHDVATPDLRSLS